MLFFFFQGMALGFFTAAGNSDYNGGIDCEKAWNLRFRTKPIYMIRANLAKVTCHVPITSAMHCVHRLLCIHFQTVYNVCKVLTVYTFRSVRSVHIVNLVYGASNVCHVGVNARYAM